MMRIVYSSLDPSLEVSRPKKKSSSQMLLDEAIVTVERDMMTRKVDTSKMFAKEYEELDRLEKQLKQLRCSAKK